MTYQMREKETLVTEKNPNHKIAIGLMGLTVFAVLVGLFNAANSQFVKSDLEVKEEKSTSFLSVLGNAAKKNHLMLVDVS
ncbi:MAG: hypothetical protein K2X66_11795, partial [Cyanobacteria bacterium]|nr:hypothetical protein [Cyanobacteriota bacterium]